MKRRNLIVITLLVAFLVADYFWSLRSHALHQWLATLIYAVLLVAADFFERRWIAKQFNQLKARYRVTNVSMWIFLFLATVSTVPNIFLAGAIDQTAFWPVVIFSASLLGATFLRRHELLRELAERETSKAV